MTNFGMKSPTQVLGKLAVNSYWFWTPRYHKLLVHKKFQGIQLIHRIKIQNWEWKSTLWDDEVDSALKKAFFFPLIYKFQIRSNNFTSGVIQLLSRLHISSKIVLCYILKNCILNLVLTVFPHFQGSIFSTHTLIRLISSEQ